MIDFSSLAIADVFAIYAVADTPSYLFRMLRGDPSVAAFSQHNSSEDLIQLVKNIDSKDVRSLEDLTIAYAAIVALTFKPFDQIRALMRWKPQHIAWGTQLIQYWDARRIPIASSDLRLPPTMVNITTQTEERRIRPKLYIADESSPARPKQTNIIYSGSNK